MHIARKALAALVLALPHTGFAQQTSTEATPAIDMRSLQSDAVRLVYTQNTIDPQVKTGIPAASLPATGSWSVAISHAGPCAAVIAPSLCFAVFYRFPQRNVVCTWFVAADENKSLEIVGEDDSAANFFIRKILPTKATAQSKLSIQLSFRQSLG